MQNISKWRTILLALLCAVLSSTALAIKPGEFAPELNLAQIDSNLQLRLSDLRGSIVYVDFWASWCGPCRQSMPLYEALFQRLNSKSFRILAVNLDEELKDAEKFLKRHPVSYSVLLDPTGKSAKAWSVPAMPTSYLVDSNGKVAYIYAGFEASHIGEIEDDIKTLLGSLPVN